MKNKIGIAVISLIMLSTAYADDSNNVLQGASDYDWQSCFSNRSSDCLNDCAISNELNCQDKCNEMARDKCKSEGFSPPSAIE